MRALYQAISQVASVPTTVLVLGESGTGMEIAASAIHRGSERALRPLVTVNVAALPETLVESERSPSFLRFDQSVASRCFLSCLGGIGRPTLLDLTDA